ncbi:MAG TPA: hypothetical protein VKG38_13575 [Solirubrobacteraceae bacterium]|nr:hypothetical protein [Solirubrobacteraceae bacterium]
MVLLAWGLTAPAGAAAARRAKGNSLPWHYAVTAFSGSATFEYSCSSCGVDEAPGSGFDEVAFRPAGGFAAGHGLLTSTGGTIVLSNVLATFTDQNSIGCGPLTESQTLSPYGGGLSFAVERARNKRPVVEVTWAFPFPHESYCYLGAIKDVGDELKKGGLLSKKVPLSSFGAHTVVLNLTGAPAVTGGGTTGTFTFQATITFYNTSSRSHG